MPRAAAPTAAPASTPALPPLDELPGHNIRRLQQIAVVISLEETDGPGITPAQSAALAAVRAPMQHAQARMLVEANHALSHAPSEHREP